MNHELCRDAHNQAVSKHNSTYNVTMSETPCLHHSMCCAHTQMKVTNTVRSINKPLTKLTEIKIEKTHKARLTLAGIDSKQISQKASSSSNACQLALVTRHTHTQLCKQHRLA